MKTIFLVVSHGFCSRYLLRTEILDRLLRAGARVVILTPNAEEPYFETEFRTQGAEIAPLYVERCRCYLGETRTARFFQYLRARALRNGNSCTTLRYKLRTEAARRSGPLLARLGLRALTAAVNRSTTLLEIVQRIENRLLTPDFHGAAFEKYQPDVVVTATVYTPADVSVLREAKRRGITTVCVVLSWDNPTSKGLAGARPDHFIAWTEVMKDELVRFHGAPPARVFVGGIAHFDVYHDLSALMTRTELARHLGLDPGRPIVLFAPWSPAGKGHLYNRRIVELLGQAVADGRLPNDTHVVVRVHPIYFRDREPDAELQEFRELCVRYPAVRLNLPETLSRRLPLDMPAREMRLVGSLVKNADVLVSFLSTMTLEAALCGTPAIHLAFDFEDDRDPVYRPSELSELAHIRRVLDTGGVRVAGSPEQMILHVNAYLKEPRLDEEGRWRIVEQECRPFDGRSGRRIAEHILAVADGSVR